MQLLVEETITDISTNIWTCLKKDMPLYLMWQYRKYYFFYLLLCRWGMIRGYTERLQVHIWIVFMAFCGKTMTRDKFFHILTILHFSDNSSEPDITGENYDWLWKMRTVFDILSDAYANS
jgi:hypothetical protein